MIGKMISIMHHEIGLERNDSRWREQSFRWVGLNFPKSPDFHQNCPGAAQDADPPNSNVGAEPPRRFFQPSFAPTAACVDTEAKSSTR
jgi:hypothetical protein